MLRVQAPGLGRAGLPFVPPPPLPSSYTQMTNLPLYAKLAATRAGWLAIAATVRDLEERALDGEWYGLLSVRALAATLV